MHLCGTVEVTQSVSIPLARSHLGWTIACLDRFWWSWPMRTKATKNV